MEIRETVRQIWTERLRDRALENREKVRQNET